MSEELHKVGDMVITVYGKSRNGNLKYSCNLNEITDGSRFFYNSQIEKFPEGVIFEKLKQGTYMFSYSKLKEVPKGATFNSLTNAKRIFELARYLTSLGDAEFQNGLNCDSICWGSGVKTAPNVNFKSMTSGWGLFNGCSLDEDSVLRVLNTVPDRSELSAANLWIGNNVNWKNSEAIAQLLQTTVPIKNGTYQYKGWNVVC